MLLALALTVTLALAGFEAHCDTIRGQVLRLHILANSDSDADQAVKLALRDRLLDECGALFGEAADYDAALAQAQKNLPALEAAAKRELAAMGCDQPVTVRLAPTDFTTRRYGDVTLPAGRYTALQVIIGKGEGHNWWCVCYPNLCLPAASPAKGVTETLPEKEADMVTRSDRYVMRFKIVEWYESLRSARS